MIRGRYIPNNTHHNIHCNKQSLPSARTARDIRASAKSGSSNVNWPALFGSSDGTCLITSDHTDLILEILLLPPLIKGGIIDVLQYIPEIDLDRAAVHDIRGATEEDSLERSIDANDIILILNVMIAFVQKSLGCFVLRSVLCYKKDTPRVKLLIVT